MCCRNACIEKPEPVADVKQLADDVKLLKSLVVHGTGRDFLVEMRIHLTLVIGHVHPDVDRCELRVSLHDALARDNTAI